MNRESELLSRALQRIGDEEPPESALQLDAACREASVTAMAAAISASQRDTRWRRRTVYGAVLAAAAAVLVLIGWRIVERPTPLARVGVARVAFPAVPGPTLHDGRGSVSLQRTLSGRSAATERLHVGDRVTTDPGSSAELTLVSGVRVTVAEQSAVTLTALERGSREVIALERGYVRVEAPPLGNGTFTVRTPDSEVVVRGTRFTVTAGAGTEVSVQQGSVAVRRLDGDSSAEAEQSLLKAGDTWSSASVKGVKTREPRRAPPSGEPPTASSLAEQNRLLGAATRALHQGDKARARTLLDELLRRFPDSPLAEEARAQRSRAGH